MDSKPSPAISVGEGKSMLDVEPITGVGPLSPEGSGSLSEARTMSEAGL